MSQKTRLRDTSIITFTFVFDLRLLLKVGVFLAVSKTGFSSFRSSAANCGLWGCRLKSGGVGADVGGWLADVKLNTGFC